MMAKRVLLVTADAALRSQFEAAFENQDDISLLKCGNDSRALQYLREDRLDFVIVSLALARDSTAPVTDNGGLDFCGAAIAISSVPITIITPSPVPDSVIDSLGALGRTVSCRPVGPDYVAKVLDQIRSAKPPRKLLDIVIRADADNRWDYELHSENFPYPFERRGHLRFDEGAQDLCKALAEIIGAGPPNWENHFKKLGMGIVRSLFNPCDSFENEVRDGVREAGGLHHTRVTFVVGREQYEIALEAVFPPVKPAPRPWMIDAPLVRNIRGQVAPNAPLFDGSRRSKRCLIVGANTNGVVDDILNSGNPIVLDRLTHIDAECHEVEKLFKESQRDIGFEAPVVVGNDRDKPLGKDEFLNLLTEPWDVIHFAGHAYHSPTIDQNGAPTAQHACLFVGKPGSPEAVEMNTIAPSLRETTSLLYLSGCKTANAGFAVAAAQYGVPAVLGFRWKVQDKPAEQHARLFYHQLFRERAIDKAFRNTRRGMRLLNRKDNAWASGMLVMASQ
jgi:hypothetical protein